MRDPLQRHIESGALDRWITGNGEPPYLSDGELCEHGNDAETCEDCVPEPDPDRAYDEARERRDE